MVFSDTSGTDFDGYIVDINNTVAHCLWLTVNHRKVQFGKS